MGVMETHGIGRKSGEWEEKIGEMKIRKMGSGECYRTPRSWGTVRSDDTTYKKGKNRLKKMKYAEKITEMIK